MKRSLLEKKLINTFNYVELSTSNYSTFSNEYASLIQSIGAELDSFFKLYCSFNFNDRKTISHYANVILQNEPAIIDIELNVLSKQLSIKPFESWSISLPAKSLSWWQSYDNIKHSRTENFIDSSLKNALYILGALYILESKYLVKIVDVSCEPDIPDEESHQSSKLHAKHFYVSRLNCVPKTYPFAHKKIPTKPINTRLCRDLPFYSNSIVPGGLLVRSYITRLTPFTSLIILVITLCNTSNGISAQSAVMKSLVHTARSATA